MQFTCAHDDAHTHTRRRMAEHVVNGSGAVVADIVAPDVQAGECAVHLHATNRDHYTANCTFSTSSSSFANAVHA